MITSNNKKRRLVSAKVRPTQAIKDVKFLQDADPY